MKRIEFRRFAGVRIRGSVPIETPEPHHFSRAEWLTAQVESGGMYGTVISYDGTGATAGLHQCVAVYPSSLGQGPLWPLIVDCIRGGGDGIEIENLLGARRWRLTAAGKVVNKAGAVVSGRAIRDQLTGSPVGLMPHAGPGRDRAERWAEALHRFFVRKTTFETQRRWGIDHIQSTVRRSLRFSVRFPDETIEDKIYSNPYVMTPELDLAMAVYLSYTVNAPSAAHKRFCRAVDRVDPKEDSNGFARFLMRKIGRSKYARWGAHHENGRYQRTRRFAKRIYSPELFEPGGLMPRKMQ